MDHIEETKLHSYADDELIESELNSIKSHLNNCLGCSAAYKDILSLKQAISDSGLLKPSENFTVSVMKRISAISSIAPVTQKNDILFRLPYLFAATLSAMVLIFILMTDSDTQSVLTLQERVQSSLNENTILGKSSLKLYEYGESLYTVFIDSSADDLGGSSTLLMMLVFAGSILIYQLFEYFQDRIRKHSQMMNLFV